MATTSFGHTSTAADEVVTTSFPIERGRLKAVAIVQTGGVSIPGSLFASISVATDPASSATISAVLLIGSFTTLQPLGWDGDIPLGPGHTIFARFHTRAAAEMKIVLTVEI
ncbi:hypothetical protein LCGC14_1151120 [marine sediment metagenome]|uniref:Uncharacterized protein n=1 Tax=marine sediment metagenome TaxID=412755 RepID=A0A0F9MIQ8_9ZZZZ